MRFSLKAIFTFTLFFIGVQLSSHVNAQSPTKEDSAKVVSLATKCLSHRHAKGDSFEYYYNQVIHLAKRNYSEQYWRLRGHNAKRNYYIKTTYREQLDGFMDVLNEEGIENAQKTKGICYKEIGRIYQTKFRYIDSSYYYYQKALTIASKNNYSALEANIHRKLGEMYSKLGDTTNCFKSFQKTISISKENNEDYSLFLDYVRYSHVLSRFNYLDSAFYYLAEANTIRTKKKVGSKHSYLTAMALVFYKKQDYKSSITYLDSSYLVLPLNDNRVAKGDYFTLKIRSLDALGRYSEMLPLIDSGALYHANTLKAKGGLYFKKYRAYQGLGMYKKALSNMILYYNFSDSLNSQERIVTVKKLELELGVLKQKVELENAHKKQFELEEKIKKNRNRFWGITLGLIVFLFILILLYWQRNRQQKREFEIKTVQMQMESLKSQMSPHFIFNAINSIKGLIINDTAEAAADQLTNFSKLMRTIINYSGGDKISLEKELEFIRLYIELERFKSDKKLNLNIEIDDNLNASEITILPFLIQPFVENCFKHAFTNASTTNPTIDILLSLESPHFLVVKIKDNGIGVKLNNNLHESKGMELTRKRLQLNNNNKDSLNVLFLGENKGTTVEFKLNLDE